MERIVCKGKYGKSELDYGKTGTSMINERHWNFSFNIEVSKKDLDQCPHQ